MSVLPVAASQATSYSYTLDDEGELVRTQDAYLPDRTITNLGLSDPEDMIIDDENNAYIVDTGNARVLVYNLDDEKVVTQIDKDTVGSKDFEGFNSPKGIFLTKSGEVYIADTGAKTVFRFKKVNETKYEFVRRYDRPTAPIFADTNYEPSKVAVDSGNNHLHRFRRCLRRYNSAWLTQVNFLGYFASNKSKLNTTAGFP